MVVAVGSAVRDNGLGDGKSLDEIFPSIEVEVEDALVGLDAAVALDLLGRAGRGGVWR